MSTIRPALGFLHVVHGSKPTSSLTFLCFWFDQVYAKRPLVVAVKCKMRARIANKIVKVSETNV